tara:strand:+ start:138 stop:2213 length:2076 start_codon:yes stop_codon:yes gene_type:complete
MPRAIELEDGTTIKNIGDSRSTQDITAWLIKNDYAVPEDIESSIYTMPELEDSENFSSRFLATEEDPETYADWVNTAFEVGPALAAGSLGIARGAKIAAEMTSAVPYPPVKAAATVIGGVIGGGIATYPLVFGGKMAGETVEALMEGRTVDPKAALNASIDAAQTDAIASGVLGLALPVGGRLYAKGKEKLGGKFTLNDKQIEQVIELQKNLKEYGSSLLPSMIRPKSWSSKFQSDLAAVSEVTSSTVDNYLEGYEKYMGDQIKKIIGDYSAAPGSAMEQGQVLQTLVRQTDEALSELVSPMYRVISETGRKIAVDPREAGLSAAKALRNQRRSQTVNNKGETVFRAKFLSDGERAATEYLETLPNNLNFWEAHQRLSAVKKKLFNVSTGPNADTVAADAWGQAKDILQKSMDDAAAKLSPELKEQYAKTTAFYREGSETVNRTYFKKALEEEEPSKIGAMFTQPGFQVGLNGIRDLKKLAAEYVNRLPKDSELRKKLNVEDPLEAIRRGYLESALKMAPEAGESSLAAFRKKLSDPKFRDTYDNLFAGTATKGKIDTLLDELEILERVSGGGGGAFSLTVRSGELAPVRNPNPSNLITGLLPGFLARNAIKAETIDNSISLMKAVTEFEKRGKPIPKELTEKLIKLMTLGQRVGVGTMGSLVEERPVTLTPRARAQQQREQRQQGMLTGQ